MRLDEIQWLKKRLKLSVREISARSGVPVGTARKIIDGTSKKPHYSNLNDIAEVLLAEAAAQKVSLVEYMTLHPDLYPPREEVMKNEVLVAESDEAARWYSSLNGGHCTDGSLAVGFSVKKPGEYTVADLEKIEKYTEGLLELIDGVIYDIGTPNIVHQMISGRVSFEIAAFVKQKGGKCIPFTAPTGVRLGGARDNRNYLIPDVMLVCDRNRINTDAIDGAPDFVLEIISPSTKGKDETVKVKAYRDYGVREYWIINPYKKRLTVYFFEDDTMPIHVTALEGSYGLNIFDGELLIDLDAIAADIDEFGKRG